MASRQSLSCQNFDMQQGGHEQAIVNGEIQGLEQYDYGQQRQAMLASCTLICLLCVLAASEHCFQQQQYSARLELEFNALR